MKISPLETAILFHVGPVPIAEAVVTTWAIMAVFVAISWVGLRRAQVGGGPIQSALEVVVEAISTQIREISGSAHATYVPLLTTLFLFLVSANLSAILPSVKAPTAHIETPAVLAVIVFLSTHYFGIRQRGLGAYFGHYTKPSLLLTPLNILSELTRTFSLMVRLFGNMMSHELVLTIMAMLAGLFVPIPFLLLGVLIGIIQAYIFTVLACVYIGAAAGSITVE
jgi:F-type H+-transporting ATPase subunit a